MNLSTDLNEPYTNVSQALTDIFPRKLIDCAFYPVRVLSIIYYIACVFWLFYIIPDIILQLRYKRSLLKRSYTSDSDHIQNSLFQCRERLVRNSLFLSFLIFEICFNLFAVFSIIPSNVFPDYPMHYNCTKIVSIHTDHHTGHSSIRKILSLLSPLEHFSFSMMIWLFGASLFHLSFAARNKLEVTKLIVFFLGGISLNMSILAAMFYVHPRIYVKIVQSFVNQISLIVVLYISKKKFFPAMNSRVIDAFHLNSLAVYNKQKRLLRQYKFLVKFILVTFELYVFKFLFFYNIYLIIHTFGINSCLNNPKYYLIFPPLSHAITAFLYNISYIFLLFVPIIDTIVYFNICFVNFAFIGSLAIRFIKRRFFIRQPHHFHVLRVPLNSEVITVYQ